MESNGDINFIVSAPGKVILFGEHSVVYKKSAVSTSISRRLNVIFSPSQENKISIKFPQTNLDIVCNVEQFEKVVGANCPLQKLNQKLSLDKPDIIDFDKYVESLKNDYEMLGIKLNNLEDKTTTALLGFLFVMRGMCSIIKCNLIPFTMEVKSDLEIGAGTGSSAAFAVAVTGAVFHYLRCLDTNSNNNFTNMTVSSIKDNIVIKSYSNKSGFSLADVKVINKWAFCIEKLMHGRPSGIDNTTCTFGSIVVTSQEPNVPGELIFRFLENIPQINILLISTGVSRNTANLVAKVRHLRESNRTAVDAIINAMDVIALEAFKTLDALGSTNSEILFKNLGGLMELNHGLLRTLGVSHESLEHIVSVSNRYGLSSKLTGAGGGGYAITLIPPNFSKNQLEEMKKDLGPAYKVSEISIAQSGVQLEKLMK